MAESIGSDYFDDSVVKVKKVSSFKHDDKIEFMAAVDSERSWLVLNELVFGRGGDTLSPVKLVDNTGKVLCSVSLYGTVSAAAADPLGNCYVAQKTKIWTISAEGSVKPLLSNPEGAIKQMTCQKTGTDYVLIVLVREKKLLFWSYHKLLTYNLNGHLMGELELKSVEQQQKGGDRPIVHIHFDTICTQRPNSYLMEFFDTKGGFAYKCSSVTLLAVFLDNLPFDHTGTALIDMKSNEYLQSKMAEERNRQKNPADILLDEVVESCISMTPKNLCRGFENAAWTERDGTITVYQCT